MNAFSFLRQLDVFIIANVSQGNDPGNVFFCFDKVYSSLDSRPWVLEKSSLARIGDVRGGFGGY